MFANKIFKPLLSQFTFAPVFNFGAADIKTLKIRMKAISSIKKITKAMKMVAASKMRIEVTRLERGKDFGVGAVQKVLDNESYLQKKKVAPTIRKTLLVPITSDKGLCGAVNSQIVREIKSKCKDNRGQYKLFVLGEKGTLALQRPFPDILHASITQIQSPINFPTAAAIAHQVLSQGDDCDNTQIVYNHFKNVISQAVRYADLMNKKDFLKQFRYVSRHEAAEPDREFAAQYFYEFYTASTFFHCLLQNNASEQSARMNAMENASKNAGEVLDKLTLMYNKARQAKITMELVEIISGANAV